VPAGDCPLRNKIQHIPFPACLGVGSARAVATERLLIDNSTRGFAIDLEITGKLREHRNRLLEECFIAADHRTCTSELFISQHRRQALHTALPLVRTQVNP